MKNKTCIVFLLDRSGSMAHIKADTIGGFNNFLDGQKNVSGECDVSLYQFDDKYDVVYEDKNIQNAPKLTNETFVPRGWTALLDAMGRTITNIGAKLSVLSENERPNKIIMVTLSDGEENHSKEFTSNQIREMITHQTEKYNWDFVFLGCNFDAVKTAVSYGIKASSSLTYDASPIGTAKAYKSVGRVVTAMRCSNMTNAVFTKEEREEQEKASKI